MIDWIVRGYGSGCSGSIVMLEFLDDHRDRHGGSLGNYAPACLSERRPPRIG
jgi:hypothetical protein